MARDNMERYRADAKSELNNDSEFLADMETEASIMHCGLTSLQAEKIERGHELGTPYYPPLDIKRPLWIGH